jgi:nucleoside phosphorylase
MLRLDRSDYTVGWLCALPLSELVAAKRMLDERHEHVQLDVDDDNSYVYGSINGNNVVIACLPPGRPGTLSAARLIQPLSRSFPNMRIHLFVGIGGGVPYNPPLDAPEKDIHLGDVVVGWADETGAPAVVQYDLVRREEGGITSSLGILNKPHWRLLNALGHLLARHSNHETRFPDHLQRVRDLEGFSHPGREKDRLFQSDYRHVEGPTCSLCDATRVVARRARSGDDLVFHQGTIASGSSVIKDAQMRDRISRENHGALCFEMEGAGVMDDKYCLVIRGIADYADSHKNGSWQKYAAATAASFARELLYTIQPQNLLTPHPVVLSKSKLMSLYGVVHYITMLGIASSCHLCGLLIVSSLCRY